MKTKLISFTLSLLLSCSVSTRAENFSAEELDRRTLERRAVEAVNWGMPLVNALRSATSIDARVLHLQDKVGAVKPGLFADLIAVEGDPTRELSSLRRIRLVMKGGQLYRNDSGRQ